MNWDEAAIRRWLEPLGGRGVEIAEVFGEILAEVVVEWTDGEIREVRARREEGTSARRRAGGVERLVCVPGCGEASAREAVRALRSETGGEPLPIRTAARTEDVEAVTLFPDAERWSRRLAGLFARHAPRHAFRFRIRQTERSVVADGGRSGSSVRRLLSLEGRFTAASRAGDEERPFSFHAPQSESAADELKSELAAAAVPRDRALPAPSGDTDVLLAGGSAAVLFHEVLGHPLEADVEASPLRNLPDARLSVSDLEVLDDPRRLDLFGGYENDDEGVAPRAARLVASGHLGGRITDRAHAAAPGSSGHGRRSGAADAPRPRGANVVVSPGSADSDEMLRRLGNGLWIDVFSGGSVELASGTFRLRFPRARRVRRGRLADELAGGILAGEILPALSGIEPAMGREARACRSFGWCSRGGDVVPVGGEAPDVLLRRLRVRPDP
ncbi:MAG TPA: metallopeptidase TldD-related protein [Thermoanaerobaculia bacterium]|nr:metallopeptidase TldD-related protein [Thermoanaerobaculia bacterium]